MSTIAQPFAAAPQPAVSEARKIAARLNGSRSRGPVSEAGKAASRRNALKHGGTAEVVLPEGDSAEVERRARALQVELAPRTVMGRFLVGRLASLTVRVERCSKQEFAAIRHRADHAEAAFDEARLAEVEALMAGLAEEPAGGVRRLRAMPEGVDRLLAALLELRDELGNGPATRWDGTHGTRLADLTGSRSSDVPVSPVRALTRAVGGDFGALLPGEGAGLPDPDRRAWARQRLVERIDAAIEDLLDHRETLDLDGIEADRAGAADRALFDPSPEATLARRYEAAAERGVYKALAELRRVEAEAESETAGAFEGGGAGESSGSFGASAFEPPPTPRPAPPPVPFLPSGRVERCNEGPQSVEPARFGIA